MGDHEHIKSEEDRWLERKRREKTRPRKCSEIVIVRRGGSVPTFQGSEEANSYRLPLPSYVQGNTMAESLADIERIPEQGSSQTVLSQS